MFLTSSISTNGISFSTLLCPPAKRVRIVLRSPLSAAAPSRYSKPDSTPQLLNMKTLSALVTGGMLLLSLVPGSQTAAIKKLSKRNNCTFSSDPDCLPNYNSQQTNATVSSVNSSILPCSALHHNPDQQAEQSKGVVANSQVSSMILNPSATSKCTTA